MTWCKRSLEIPMFTSNLLPPEPFCNSGSLGNAAVARMSIPAAYWFKKKYVCYSHSSNLETNVAHSVVVLGILSSGYKVELLVDNDIIFQAFIFMREGNIQLMYARLLRTADKCRLLQPSDSFVGKRAALKRSTEHLDVKSAFQFCVLF